jgi:Protein of unknown function (DUF3828)
VRDDAVLRLLPAIALCAAIALSSVPLRAQTAAGARIFLAGVYSHYQYGGKGIDFEGPAAALYFHSTLIALIRQDIRANGPGNAPAIDFDPICACQDWKGIWSLKIDAQMETPKRVHARVAFSLAPPKNPSKDAMRQLAITLVPERGAWRIYDIEDDSDSSTTFALRKLIQDDIDTLRRDAGGEANH